MSRTYHHGNKWRLRLRTRCQHILTPCFRVKYAGGRMVKYDEYLGFHTETESKEWRRYFKHKPHRAKTRQCLRKLMKGYDPDGMVWPVSGRPWIYYW